MVRTKLKEKIYDIKHKTSKEGDYALCLISVKGQSKWVPVPYSAIEWVSSDWID